MNDQSKDTPSDSLQPKNTDSLLDRLYAVCGCPQPTYAPAPLQPQHAQLTPQSINNAVIINGLQSAYSTALHDYCAAISYTLDLLPACLDNPLAHFYSLKGRRNCIFAYEPFPYAIWDSTKVSKRTFPSLLRYCEIPDGPSDLRDVLFDALRKLVQDYPYNERDILMKEIIRKNPLFAQFLWQNVIVSPEHNLFCFFKSPTFHSFFEYIPMLSANLPIPKAVNKSVLKRYLSIVARETDQQNQQCQPEDPFPAKSLLFYGGVPNRKFQLLSYESGFVISDLQEPLFPVKALPYLKAPDHVPTGAATWLFHLTGGDVEQVDRLAELLARASSPAPSDTNMTVVCSRENSELLKTLFGHVLSPLILTSGPKPSERAGSSLPSLNQFCRTTNLLQLYSAQGMGQGVAFVRDIEVSDTARPVLKKLLTGKSIALSSPYLPRQYLRCKTHFICISQDPQKARKLSQSLKVPLIDLSSSEISLESPQELTPKDISWLRSVFLPYGLAERKTAVKPEKTPAPFDWVYEFLSEFCSVKPDSRCHRETLYSDYAACYRHTHPGLEPPLTQGRFVKAVKPYLGKGELRHVSYRKIRSEQKMYFVGLACPDELPVPAPVPDETHTDSFTAHLEAIHSMRPSFSLKSNLQVKVSLPSGK